MKPKNRKVVHNIKKRKEKKMVKLRQRKLLNKEVFIIPFTVN